MRKVALSLAVVALALTVAIWYPSYVEKPVKDGKGPLSLYVDPSLSAPEYHSPLDQWQLSHADIMKRVDLVQADCLQCHVPETHCNRCHRYVGAADIVP